MRILPPYTLLKSVPAVTGLLCIIYYTDGSRRSSECRANSECSQKPRHLISDAYEWINKIPSVPIYYLAKPQPRERAWQNQRGKKTLLSLTLV
ncbi:hypothetical protein T05_1794 [Trichinella murrelli]|uniref:Uncharacterized protein n=1 Tax=Trichinella murrelli TaxID=144512 RepID=A0A0V0TAM3_9BILA|nr:hypothetical protein T05_1794 [Trichinella murrelli]